MATTVVKFITTQESKLDQLEVSNGQLIFVKDSHKILLDSQGTRTEYSSSFLMLSFDSSRESMVYPLETFYFVLETNILWRYDSYEGWIQITQPPQQQIVFLDEEDFPLLGSAKTLYISGLDMYRWRNGGYEKMGQQYWQELN